MENWIYRKPILVSQTGLAQITLSFEQGMKADFSDVRFVAADGETLLDYQRVSYNAGQDALFFVDASAPNMFAYFGNENATYESTWTPPQTVVDEIDHEKGYVKNSGNPIIAPGASGQWDDYFVYSVAPIEKDGTIFLFYSGNRNEGANPKHAGSIGLTTSEDGGATYIKQGMVIDKASVSGIAGMAPFCVIEINGLYYLFVCTFHASGSIYRVAYFTSEDLQTWSGATWVTGLDTNSHAPFVMNDPNDADKLIMYYTDISGTPFIRRAVANKSDPSIWSGKVTVLSDASAVLYPCVTHKNGVYEMMYSRQLSGGGYSTYKTASKDGLSFIDSDLRVIPNGGSGAWDESYITVPRILGDKLFYTARKAGVQGYQGVGECNIDDVGGVLGWDWSLGNLPFATAEAKEGSFGGRLNGNANKPGVYKLAPGKNHTYEIWIYDDMSMAANVQNTFRLDDGSPDLLVGIYTQTSTSKYIYRKKGGTWTASAINRSLGWHKLTFEVGDDVKVYIDDILIATDTVFDVDAFNAVAIYAYTSGYAIFDSYRVIGIDDMVDVQVGTELAPI